MQERSKSGRTRTLSQHCPSRAPAHDSMRNNSNSSTISRPVRETPLRTVWRTLQCPTQVGLIQQIANGPTSTLTTEQVAARLPSTGTW